MCISYVTARDLPVFASGESPGAAVCESVRGDDAELLQHPRVPQPRRSSARGGHPAGTRHRLLRQHTNHRAHLI